MYFIGLMSGTSLDGMDAALVEVRNGEALYCGHLHLPMPEALRRAFLALNEAGENELHRLAEAAWQHADLAAAAVQQLLQQEALPASAIRALGLHGQTVRHCPQHSPPYTWQVHQAARLAELTGIDCVTDFRSRDVAAGGQGAPLAPLFQRALAFWTHRASAALMWAPAMFCWMPGWKNIRASASMRPVPGRGQGKF